MQVWQPKIKTKRYCLTGWLITAGLLIGLTLLQTLTGALQDMEWLAWGWATAHLLPGVGLLLASLSLRNTKHHLLPHGIHRMLVYLTAAYLALLLFTALLEQYAVARSALSMELYRQRSFAWLMPFQLLLLFGYYQLLIKREAPFRPSTAAIQHFARQEAARWTTDGQDWRYENYRLVAEGNLGMVLDQLYQLAADGEAEKLTEVVVLRSRWSALERESELETIDADTAQRHRNRLAVSILELMRSWKLPEGIGIEDGSPVDVSD